jgi:hypothetical protein
MMNGVPFFRDLKRCRSKDHIEAVKEVVSTFVLAIIPVWLGAFLMMLIPRASASHYLQEFLTSGEALLVSAALIGPSIYVITKKYGELPKSLTIHFPQGWFLIVILLLICMMASAVFGVQRGYSQIMPAQPDLFDPRLMQELSLAVLLGTLATFYFVTVFKNFAEDGASSEMHSDTESFLEEWRAAGRRPNSNNPGDER